MELPKQLYFSHNNIQIRATLVEGAATWITGECCVCRCPLQGHTFYTTDPPEFSIHSVCALQILSPQISRSIGEGCRDIQVEGSRVIWLPPPHPHPHPRPHPYYPSHPQSHIHPHPHPHPHPYYPYHPQSHMNTFPSYVPNIHDHYYPYYPPPPNYCAHYPPTPLQSFQQGHGNGAQPPYNVCGKRLGSLAKTALGAFLRVLLEAVVTAIVL